MSKIDKATRILLAGFCINLCLGILYAWSVFNKALQGEGWSAAEASAPYATATITFSICLLVAGILQDRMGPRKILILGTALRSEEHTSELQSRHIISYAVFC